jgi:chromosome segregation ATPase
MVNLQKELRDKHTKLNSAQNALEQMEAAHRAIKENHSSLLEQTSLLNSALKEVTFRF